MQTGSIGVKTENIFPVIKKFLYSENEIFLREIISNAVDATQKLKTLASAGEFNGELGDLTVKVEVDKKKKTITVRDNGIGMTEQEVDKYINQIAFSGATDFVEKFKNNSEAEAANIIGHFGLGFYSAFMVSSKVSLITKSYAQKADEKGVIWECDGSPEYTMNPIAKANRGTDVILYISDDCADWADTEVLLKIIGILKDLEQKGTKVDLFLANYIFDREDSDKKTVMRFKGAFPKGRPFTWDEVGHMGQSQFIMMHTIIYRREVLLQSGTELPKHAYYVDNIYAFQPLPFTKTVYYLDEALYHYRIGRADQSVNVQVQLKNIDQQIMVDKRITDIYVNRPEGLSARLEKYLIAFLKLMYCATSAILLVGGTPEHLAKKEELWDYLEKADPIAYKKIRRSFMGGWMNLPGALGRKISVLGYKISQKIFAFN